MTTTTVAPEQYLATLHKLMERYFNLEEIQTLCFQLNVDYDSVRGEGKSARIRHLILDMGRHGRLAQLVSLVAAERPFVSWPPVPDDLDLPAALAAADPAAQVVNHNYYGDVVHGHKTQVGNVSGEGIAIGPGASANVTHGDKFDMSGNFQGAILNIKSTLTNVTQTIGAIPSADESSKQELERLVAQLNGLLQQAPVSEAETAQEVAEATEILVSTAAADNPNKTMVKLLGEGLKQTAQKLKANLPQIVDLTANIVTIVSALATKTN
jgi:hypothetical protein